WRAVLNVRRVIICPEFADEYRRDVVCADVAPEFVPYRREGGETRIAVEPALLKECRTVIVWRVHQTVGDIEHDRIRSDTLQVAAPPIAIAVVAVRTLNDDQ